MIRIRFHGRGGHGAKTASRIVGTAAFLGGYQAQDSPVYGAERRGAAVVAYARIDSQPILERGVIEQPDLIILADETLLEAPDAGVLASQDAASAIFINTSDAEALVSKYDIRAPVTAIDLTTLALECVGSASALSAGVAAAAVRLCGIVQLEHLLQAVREEFAHLHLFDRPGGSKSPTGRQGVRGLGAGSPARSRPASPGDDGGSAIRCALGGRAQHPECRQRGRAKHGHMARRAARD